MRQPVFAAVLGLLFCWGLLGAAQCPGADRDPAAGPNIVLIVADDLGYGDLGCYGCTDTRTPALDRLARQGIRFTNFYANAPECTPTRTALMTGRYQQRVGGLECAIGTGNVGRYDDAVRLAEQGELGLPPEQNVLVQGLNQAGYVCVGFGKWHLGYEPKFGPLHHGFAHFFGPLGGGVDYFYHCEWDGTHMLYEDERPVRREGYLTDLITEAALGFLREHQGTKPFLLYLPYTAPHTPIQHPDRKPPHPRKQENWNEGDRATYAAMVERMDKGIASVLAMLDERAWTEETLVVFFSDNGGTSLARNDPFSGHKGGLFEGGIRVPCMVRWPGVLAEGQVTDQAAITMDFTRSLLRVAGRQAPAHLPPDGIDILARLQQDRPAEARTLFWRQRRGEQTWRAVRSADLKYVSRDRGGRLEEHLFDLGRDPGEKQDLLEARPDDAARLKALLGQWEKEVRPARRAGP